MSDDGERAEYHTERFFAQKRDRNSKQTSDDKKKSSDGDEKDQQMILSVDTTVIHSSTTKASQTSMLTRKNYEQIEGLQVSLLSTSSLRFNFALTVATHYPNFSRNSCRFCKSKYIRHIKISATETNNIV